MKSAVRNWMIAGLGLAMVTTGCRKDDYEIPGTYIFENVSYSGQTARLDMLEELGEYMESAATPGTVLSAARMKDMFTNQNNPFTFTSTKQLKDKCFLTEQTVIEQWMDSLAAASTSAVAAAAGMAGVAVSDDGTKQYLLAANGYDYAELIEKGIMGAVFYYQATGVYLSESGIGAGVDNETVVAGEGTTMQHHWDEAFGYLGVATNFPTNTTDSRYWGKYSNTVNPSIGSNKALMDAFLLGRAAIVNEDYETKDTQAAVIRATWDKLAAAMAIHYLNKGKSHLADDALRCHELSEAIGFTRALRYNPVKTPTETQIQAVLDAIGADLYAVTAQGLDNARNQLASIYGLESVKDAL